MKTVILAAGRGTRLGALTEDKPKCMLELGEETILERQIRILQECGINIADILVVVGYKKECIEAKLSVNCIYNDEYTTTDNSYSLFLALTGVNEDVLVLDGDLVFESQSIKILLASMRTTLLGISENAGYGATGIEYVDKDNSVTAIGKHITSDVTYASIMRINRDDIVSLRDTLGMPQNKKTWYTVPLNKILTSLHASLTVSPTPIMGVNSYFDYIDAKRIFAIEDFSILVTGASGFLGKKIYNILKRDFIVEGIKGQSDDMDIPSVDLTDQKAIEAYIELRRPSVIVHTAGIPDPDICESNRNKAYMINVTATEILTNICRERNIKLIHISTDYVFNGELQAEYGYDSKRKPKNYYGETKCMAEDIVKSYDNSLIVRIPIIYGYNDENDRETFPITVIHKLKKGMELYLDNHQIRYPVLIDDVAIAIRQSLAKTGVMHILGNEATTKYLWAKIIAKEFKLDERLIKEAPIIEINNRPQHVKLRITDRDYCTTGVGIGTGVLRRQQYCAFKLIYKSKPIENIYGKNIGDYRYRLGQKLGKSLPQYVVEQLDCVMPVPTSGMYYAMGMSETIKVPYLQGLIKPDSLTRSFQIADITLRERTIRTKIQPIENLIKGKNIALVDEAIFTGTTLRVVCDMLKACGANQIFICLPTPVCRNKCMQYVHPERELLSQYINEQDLKDYFRVEGVFFQPYDDFAASVDDVEHICYECFAKER